ncbi:uncharacterized protein LOC105280915 isoform X2 [Ooceraea biroi]|uniref:uncharacterized protein LOC105280915 isoform X2 n=1 Tax=Ooceraea biroi TaxID=2015173 RepID=UPI000F083564|nr:uncharacterized protein LOC105280915 isoform X2 [Ooceraea biroi]
MDIMCEENSHFDSEMEIFSPTHSYVECNDDMQCDRYLYPEKTYDTQKNMEGEKEFMSEVPEQDENTSYIDVCGTIQDFTELLISEVQKRPALYNIKSSIQSRSRVIVNQMWQEIFEIFEGQIPVEELKRSWKIQRDRYMRIRSDMKKKPRSGSSAATKKHPNYKYYKLISFLDDSMEQRKTRPTIFHH